MKKNHREIAALPHRHRLAQAFFLAFGAAAAGCLLPLSAGAQEQPAAASGEKLDTVTVTARKREEVLLDVPISVQVFSDRELRNAGITDLQSLKNFSGFTFQQSTQGSTFASGRTLGVIVFRGLQSTSAAPRDNSGSLFVDGIFISGGQSTVSTVGLERVEVLKGPQNTYFGRNTFGGAVNFITKNPPSTFKGEINTSITARGSSDVDATLGGPLGSDALTGSLTVLNHNKVAQYHATDGGDLGAEKTKSISGTLYAKPVEGLWLRARAQYQQDDDSSAPIAYISATRFGGTCAGSTYTGGTLTGTSITFTPTVPYFCGTVPQPSALGGVSNVLDANTNIPAIARDAFTNNSLGDPFASKAPRLDHTGMRRDTEHFSLQGGYDLPYQANLGFSAGYNKAATRTIWDLDRSATNNFLNSATILSDDLTLDARLSSDAAQRIRGLLGVSYFKSTYKLSQVDYNEYTAALAAGGPSLNTSSYSNDKSSVPAAYGSVEVDILSNLTFSLEGRFQQDKSATTTRITQAHYEQKYSNFLPRGTLAWRPDPSTNIYATVAKGVQPTSFDATFTNLNAAQKAYVQAVVPTASIFSPQPTIENFELGIKQRLMGDRVEYSLAAYRINWHHQITPAALFNPAACVASGTSNTAACPLALGGAFINQTNDAYIRGIEFSALGLVTDNWTLGFSVDLKSPKWKSFYDSAQSGFTGGAVQFNGNTLSRTPKVSGALNSTYTAPLFNGWNWFTRGDVLYTGKQYESNINIATTDAYTRVNARAGITKKNVTVELFSTNLFDDKHWDYAYKLTDLSLSPLTSFSQQGVAAYAPDRREIGVRLRYAFD